MMNETLVEGDGDHGDGERSIPIEVAVGDDAEARPPVDDATRVDVEVEGRMYPTARLADGRYVAWWFDTNAPDLDDPVTTEWVAAPTPHKSPSAARHTVGCKSVPDVVEPVGEYPSLMIPIYKRAESSISSTGIVTT